MRSSRARALGALLFCGLAARGASPESLSEAVDRYDRPALTGRALQVENADFTFGRLKLELKSGVLAPIAAGTEPMGFFFRGKGSWTYSSDCADEFPVVEENVSRASHWRTVRNDSTVSLGDDFEELLWASPGPPLWPEEGKPAKVPESDFRKFTEYFSRLKTLSLPQRLTFQQREGTSGRLAWGELRGGKHECLYLHDPAVRGYESLSLIQKAEFDSVNARPELVNSLISRQPIPPRPYRQARKERGILTAVALD